MKIPFNRPHMTGREFVCLEEAIRNNHLSGDGPFTRRCQELLERKIGCRRTLLTHSCTAALEMAAILSGVGPGDEVILPSYTFVSTANAFVLRGATPVFVDVRADTLNIDETRIEQAITEKTRAIVAVHYAGVSCEMDAILDIAKRHRLLVVEDAAQAIGSRYRGKPVGSLGNVSALSFHETKNVISGEGGALLVNDPALVERAEIIWEKGTDRRRFFRGQVDKYTWVDIGSSFLPGEVVAAFLWAQLQDADSITARRVALWDGYLRRLAPKAARAGLTLPTVPAHCAHNAHMFYVLVPRAGRRAEVLARMNEAGVNAVFHYVPLHGSPAGRKYGRVSGTMSVTDDVSARLIRLPLWADLSEAEADYVCETLVQALGDGGD